jgi:hypothetical protein
VLYDRLHGWCRALRGEVVFLHPGGEWFGEQAVVAAGVVEVVGGVDECGGAWGVSVGPVGPGVEGVESMLILEEPVVVAVELSGELLVRGEVVLESVAFGAEFGSLVEEWLGAAGDLVECGVGGGDVVGGIGDGVSCGSAVESS